MRLPSLALLFVASCGAFAGWLVSALVPPAPRADEPTVRTEDFRLVRKADDAVEVTDAKWFTVPFLFGDFDLHMDIELGEKVDLDVVLRQVEPRIVQNQLRSFHGRFCVLRMSTVKNGPAWLTREQALFDPRAGGVELAAGYAATVWVQGRGRMLRANVAGKWQPWFAADDEYGMFTLVARGGTVVLHNFVVETRGLLRAWLWSRWFWAGVGALGALIVFAVAHARAERGKWFLTAGLLLIGACWLGSRLGDVELALPAPSALLQMLVAALLLALASLRSVRALAMLAMVGAALLLLWNADRHLHHDGSQLDPVFGPRAGETISEALAQRVRGPFGVHTIGPAAHRVFLLGGKLLYDRGAPVEHLEPMLTGQLRGALREQVDVPCLPTVDGHTQQQWRMFTTFFTGYRPNVIVFGVPRDEAAVDEATGTPRSDPSTLATTLRAAREHCQANDCKLVVFTEAELPSDLMGVLRLAERDGVPLVIAGAAEAPAERAKKLAAAILPLRKPR